MRVNTGVFERDGNDVLSERGFFFALGLAVVYGLAGTAFVASKFAAMHYNPGWMGIIIIGLVIPIIGIVIAIKSDNPFISFVGYNMVVVPFGVILAPVLNVYSPNVIRNAFGMTAVITCVMCCLSTIYPAWFSRLGGVLFSCLLGLVLVRVLQLIFPALGQFTIVDWIGAGIFSLYIGYDWYRANNVPKTLDNAVDIALDLYLDIINLFLLILRIMGKNKD
jgi:FtsH-binding integral membrane protein